MDTPVSREKLLDCAYATADRYGLAALSIRGLASECGVSVGTIYNHFPSKTELTAATAELYFKRAFFEELCHPAPQERYLDYCERMFASMGRAIAHFRAQWLKGAESLPTAERAEAHLREGERFEHIRNGLVAVFEADPAIRRDLPDCLNAEAVGKFTLRNVLAELRSDAPDCSVLFAMLGSALYEE